MRFTAPLLLSAVLLTACAEAPAPGSFDRDLNRKTAGAAVVSGLAKMCGARRIEAYRDSFVATMKSQRAVSPEAEAKIRAQFTRVDADVMLRFPDATARQTYCTQYPADQATIDRGVAGDFSGQI